MVKKKAGSSLAEHIRGKVINGRAPPCPKCCSCGTIAGGQIGFVVCSNCGNRYKNLAQAWREAIKKSAKNPGITWWQK